MDLYSEEVKRTSEELLQNSMMNQEENMNPHVILTGEVVHGKALGRTVGMPTANLRVEGEELPKSGVYATRIKIGETVYASVTNVGRRPSVDDEKYITVESFIIDFQGEIYGERVELEFVAYLRAVQKFENLEAVSAQVKKDIANAKQYL